MLYDLLEKYAIRKGRTLTTVKPELIKSDSTLKVKVPAIKITVTRLSMRIQLILRYLLASGRCWSMVFMSPRLDPPSPMYAPNKPLKNWKSVPLDPLLSTLHSILLVLSLLAYILMKDSFDRPC